MTRRSLTAKQREEPKRIQRKRTKGWKMPPNTVSVTRPGPWGNPFDFRRPEYCWAALSFGCRGDAIGRQEASVRAFRDWIDPPYGRQTLSFEEQPKLAAQGKEMTLGPTVKAGAAPSRDPKATRERVHHRRNRSHDCLMPHTRTERRDG